MLGTLLCLLCAGCLSSPFFPASLYFTGTVLCPPFVISTPFYMDFFSFFLFLLIFFSSQTLMFYPQDFRCTEHTDFSLPVNPLVPFHIFQINMHPTVHFSKHCPLLICFLFLPWLHCTNIENSRPLLGPALSG